MKRAGLYLAGAALAVACANTPAPTPDPFPTLPQAEIEVATAGGVHRIQVWIAADDRSRTRGLMFVREMAADRGMLFLFGEPQFVSFWMKNTWLPLDLVFIDGDGIVVNVAAQATPFSLEPIRSEAPVTAVLELVGGTAGRIGLSRGNRIRHPASGAVR